MAIYYLIYCWHFIDHKVKLLHIMLPRIRAYVKGYDGQTKWINFLIEDDNLLKDIKLFGIKPVLFSKKIDAKPVYDKTF